MPVHGAGSILTFSMGDLEMKKSNVMIVLGIAVMLLGNVAQAGFVNPADVPGAAAFSCDFTSDDNSHDWDFDYSGPILTLSEVISAAGPDEVLIGGETDSDPIFTVIKTIENDSGVTWTGYTLSLSGSGLPTFVEGTAGAAGGKLSVVDYVHPAAISFSGDNPVYDGETLALQFDVLVPTTGLFDFTLTQHPVPEPATIGLLSLGSLMLYRKRRA